MSWQKESPIVAPDPLDRAADLAEAERHAAAQVRRPEGPGATGRCLYCGAELEAELLPEIAEETAVRLRTHIPRRWCNAECRDGWEAEV